MSFIFAAALEVAVHRLRPVCSFERFLVCMRWDRAVSDRIANESIDSGVAASQGQIKELSERLRAMPEVVDSLFVDTTMGALLKASGLRLKNGLADPSLLRAIRGGKDMSVKHKRTIEVSAVWVEMRNMERITAYTGVEI